MQSSWVEAVVVPLVEHDAVRAETAYVECIEQQLELWVVVLVRRPNRPRKREFGFYVDD
jgi:hypothetical protein